MVRASFTTSPHGGILSVLPASPSNCAAPGLLTDTNYKSTSSNGPLRTSIPTLYSHVRLQCPTQKHSNDADEDPPASGSFTAIIYQHFLFRPLSWLPSNPAFNRPQWVGLISLESQEPSWRLPTMDRTIPRTNRWLRTLLVNINIFNLQFLQWPERLLPWVFTPPHIHIAERSRKALLPDSEVRGAQMVHPGDRCRKTLVLNEAQFENLCCAAFGDVCLMMHLQALTMKATKASKDDALSVQSGSRHLKIFYILLSGWRNTLLFHFRIRYPCHTRFQ